MLLALGAAGSDASEVRPANKGIKTSFWNSTFKCCQKFALLIEGLRLSTWMVSSTSSMSEVRPANKGIKTTCTMIAVTSNYVRSSPC